MTLLNVSYFVVVLPIVPEARNSAIRPEKVQMRQTTLRAVAISIAMLTCGKALATTPPDPCQSSAIVKQSVAISLPGSSSGTVVELVAASAHSIHVCGFLVQSPSPFSFLYGSGGACSSNPVPLTGALTSAEAYPATGTVLSIPAGNSLCISLGPGSEGAAVGVATFTEP